MKKNVFISSTYEDLIEHRKAIWELLKNYEVNVKGMEAFGARKETPLETCLNEVSQSDIYIGIIGYRFGSIERNSGKSYTQLEYEKAVDEKKEILIYLINEKDSKVSIQYVDFGENRNKLQNFKRILKDKHTIDTFTTAKNLTSKLERRLDEILVESTKNDIAKDNYDESKKIIERFLLLPKLYSDRDVKLMIQFDGRAFPISKDVSYTFGFAYGGTIGVPIKIIKPELDSSDLNTLIIKENNIELFFENNRDDKIEIIARILFTDKRIENIRSNFFDRTQTKLIENPNYDPELPLSGKFLTTFPLTTYNQPYYETSELIKGDGKAILVLNKVVNKAQPPIKAIPNKG